MSSSEPTGPAGDPGHGTPLPVGASAAPAGPPSLSSTPAPASAGAGELTPWQRRKAREAEKRAELDRRRAERAARRAAAAGEAPPATSSKGNTSGARAAAAAPASSSAPPAAAEPHRTDTQLRDDLASFLLGLWEVAAFLVGFAGYELRELTAPEAAEDAALWVPLARRYVFLQRWAGHIAAPVRLVRRVREKLHRKGAAPPAPAPAAGRGDA